MRYMVIERFKDGCAKAIYERARESGRMLPDGLEYVESWVSTKLDMCWQLMECADVTLLEEWFRRWEDLVEFELVPVVSSAEASALALAGLDGDSPERYS